MPSYCLVASDIDGTLTNRTKQVGDATVSELRRIAKLGVEIVYASSRMPRSIRKLMRDIGARGHVVAYNGAIVELESEVGVERLRDDPLNFDVFAALTAQFMDAPPKSAAHIGLFIDDKWFVRTRDYWTERESLTNRTMPDDHGFETALATMTSHGRGPHKVMIRGTESEVDAMLGYWSQHGVDIYRPKSNIAELTSARSNKASGIDMLRERLGVSRDNVVAFGDNMNDLGMLRGAGWAVAMANAPEALKAEADEVTASNDDDGVALALRRLFR